MKRKSMPDRDDAWKNILAGAIGGLVASWVMNRYQELQNKAVQSIKKAAQSEKRSVVTMEQRAAVGSQERWERPQPQPEVQERQEPTTVKIAEIISINVLRHRLNERQKRIAEPIVHYSFGTLMGAWYGVLSELTPLATMGRGTLYGAAVWLGADEIALPALKLANSPFEYPLSVHASALSAHAVYGITLDTVRRGTLKLLNQ
ncbi:MAG TPA: DUF1440 domain-containing protein [Terriglobales bacterium]|nr:DUF1440 domain-containing protein [Terriglobales bacterium]